MVKRILMLTLCFVYLYGNTMEFKKIETKAKTGDAKSQYELGVFYNNGNDDYNIKQNLEEACIWYQKAAQNGNKDAILALLLLREAKDQLSNKDNETNNVIIEDKKKIDLKDTELFNSLVTKANKGDAKAQYQLGLIYSNGYGVVQDRKEAILWYEKSSMQGYKDAILALEILREVDN